MLLIYYDSVFCENDDSHSNQDQWSTSGTSSGTESDQSLGLGVICWHKFKHNESLKILSIDASIIGRIYRGIHKSLKVTTNDHYQLIY